MPKLTAKPRPLTMMAPRQAKNAGGGDDVMAEDDAEELTEEEAEDIILKGAWETIQLALVNDDVPLILEALKTTRRGRVVAYFDWDVEALTGEDDEEE